MSLSGKKFWESERISTVQNGTQEEFLRCRLQAAINGCPFGLKSYP
jgi:hypothetical protein